MLMVANPICFLINTLWFATAKTSFTGLNNYIWKFLFWSEKCAKATEKNCNQSETTWNFHCKWRWRVSLSVMCAVNDKCVQTSKKSAHYFDRERGERGELCANQIEKWDQSVGSLVKSVAFSVLSIEKNCISQLF